MSGVEHFLRNGDLVFDQWSHEKERIDVGEYRRRHRLGEVERNDVGYVWQQRRDFLHPPCTHTNCYATGKKRVTDFTTDGAGRTRDENPH